MGCIISLLAVVLLVFGVFMFFAGIVMEDFAVIGFGLVIVAAGSLVIRFTRNEEPQRTVYRRSEPLKKSYPYRPEVEKRLPNGKITTSGYAARHPHEFAHWRSGPYNVMGESIDPLDWEKWRENYYG